jgi:hypothetical protein
MNSGRELDRNLRDRIFGSSRKRYVPPFSTRDWSAIALAELVSRRTGWKYQLLAQGGTFTAIWFEGEGSLEGPPAMAMGKGRTRALALCRALLEATRSPAWSKFSHAGADHLGVMAPHLPPE